MKKTLKILSVILSIVFILNLFTIQSCDRWNPKPKCDSDNPLEDIQWLKEKKQNLEINTGIAGWQIIRYRYKGDYVFRIDPCYQCADGLIFVYDCSGEVICEFGGIDGRNTCIDFETESSDSTMLIDAVQY